MIFALESYQEQITDLIGLRALHLFKGDWHSIDGFVRETWDLHEDPIAYIRVGDSELLPEELGVPKCKVTVHPFGYRSIHYLLKFQPRKELTSPNYRFARSLRKVGAKLIIASGTLAARMTLTSPIFSESSTDWRGAPMKWGPSYRRSVGWPTSKPTSSRNVTDDRSE